MKETTLLVEFDDSTHLDPRADIRVANATIINAYGRALGRVQSGRIVSPREVELHVYFWGENFNPNKVKLDLGEYPIEGYKKRGKRMIHSEIGSIKKITWDIPRKF